MEKALVRHYRKMRNDLSSKDGGAEGIRTPDPHNAIVVLYQLSYDPIQYAQIFGEIRLLRKVKNIKIVAAPTNRLFPPLRKGGAEFRRRNFRRLGLHVRHRGAGRLFEVNFRAQN